MGCNHLASVDLCKHEASPIPKISSLDLQIPHEHCTHTQTGGSTDRERASSGGGIGKDRVTELNKGISLVRVKCHHYFDNSQRLKTNHNENGKFNTESKAKQKSRITLDASIAPFNLEFSKTDKKAG